MFSRFSRRRSAAIATLAATFFSLAMSMPASAAITGTSASSPNATQTTPCPTTVSLSGTIKGTPNQPFQYWFGWLINNNLTVQSATTLTMPASGTANVSTSLPVTATTMSGSVAQLGASTALDGSMSNPVLSNDVPVQITCQAPGTPPAPTQLQNTTNATVCGDHIVFLCSLLSAGAMALVWNWSPTASVPTLGGYNVYQVNGNTYTNVSHGTGGAGITGTFLNPPSGGFSGKCYVVRAYSGSLESGNSNQFCVSGTGVLAPMVLTPSAAATLGINRQVRGLSEALFTNGIGCGTANGDICMGWSHWEDGTAPFEIYDDQFYRGYVDYSQSQLASTHYIIKATLNMPIDAGTSPSCFGSLSVATGQWIGQQEPTVNGDGSYGLSPVFSGNSVSFDVTQVARDWATGVRPNFGFVFEGTQENNEIRENRSCFFQLSRNSQMTVTYY